MTDAEYQDALETAESIGKDHGENAAAWWEQENVGGRVSNRADAEHAARTTIDACEDGDPCLYDAIPAPDLSGQGADGYSSQDLMDALGIEDDSSDCMTDLCDVYEMAFVDACETAVILACRAAL